MKRILVALILGLGIIAPLGVHRSASAAVSTTPKTLASGPQNCQGQHQGNNKCCPKGYKPKDCDGQVHGTMSASVPGTTARLTGIGTSRTAGSKIVVVRVTPLHMLKGAHAFKVLTNGRIPALKLAAKGILYRLNVATNRWMRVTAVTGSGIYAAVLR